MNAPDFSAVLRDIRAEEFDERERARIEALLATEAQVLASALCSEQRNLLIRREHTARDRRFSAEPVAITGFGPFSTRDEEPELSPSERAYEDHQNWLEVRDREERA